MTKTAIIVGHNSKAQGAIRVKDGETEYSFNARLAERVREFAACENRSQDIRIFYRQPGLSYAREIDESYARVNEWKPDFAVEFHFNAATPAATGTEMLHAEGSTRGASLAQKLQDATLNALKLRNRGLKPLARGARGSRSVWSSRAPAVLTEWFFGSNAGDCEAADRNFDALAREIWRAVK